MLLTKRALRAIWKTPHQPKLHGLRVAELKIRAIVHLALKNQVKVQGAQNAVKPKAGNQIR
jgi:hypothetical protein